MKSKASKSKNSKLTNVLYKDNNMFMLLILALVIIIIIFLFRRKNSKPYESFRTRTRKRKPYQNDNIDERGMRESGENDTDYDEALRTGEYDETGRPYDDTLPVIESDETSRMMKSETGMGYRDATHMSDDESDMIYNDATHMSDDESDMIYNDATHKSDADIPRIPGGGGGGIQGEQCSKLNSTLNNLFKENNEYEELIALQNNLSTSITENTKSINDFTNDKINIKKLIQDILKNGKIESTISSKFDSNFNSLRNTILKKYNKNDDLFKKQIHNLARKIEKLGNADKAAVAKLTEYVKLLLVQQQPY
jgi:hypothetical protein